MVLSLEVAVPGQLAWFLWGSGPEEYAAKTQGNKEAKHRKQEGSRKRKRGRTCSGPKVIFKDTVLISYHFSLDPTKFSLPPNKVDRDQAINMWDPEGHLACV